MKTPQQIIIGFLTLLFFALLSERAMSEIVTRPIGPSDEIKGSRFEDGKNHGLFPKECGKEVLRDIVMKDGNLQSYFNKCERYIRDNNHRLALLKYIRTKYPATADKSHHIITFKLEDGTQLRGILVLHKSSTPRPLVLIKGGIYSDAIFEGSTNNLLTQYSGDAPFHALFLESTTAKEYLRRNKSIVFGGLVESHQMIEVLRNLENSKYANKISEVHVVGISLGGNAALLLENSLTHADALTTRFQPRSVTAHCPVINLKRSFRNMFSTTLAGRGGVIFLRNLLRDIRDEVPLINVLFGSRSVRSCNRDELEDIMQNANSDFYRNYYRRHYENSRFEIERDLYEANDYRNFVSQTAIPTYIVHAKDDHIVRFKDNLGLMLETHGNEISPNVQTIVLEQGDHCAYSHVYNWGHMSTLFKSIIYRNSHETEKSKVFDVKNVIASDRTIFGNPSIRFKRGDAIADYYFKKHKDNKGLKLKFKIFRAQREKGSCASYRYYQAPKGCYDFESVYLSAQQVGMNNPSNEEFENDILRKLNSQGMLLNAKDRDVRGLAELPSKFKLSLW